MDQHLTREIAGRKTGKHRVKGQFVKMIDAQPRKAVGARLGVHQPEGGRAGGEEFAWMRLEGDDAKRRIAGGARGIDHRTVPQMHAVEIAHGNAGSAGLGRQASPIVMDAQSVPRWAQGGPVVQIPAGRTRMRRPAQVQARIA